jgi:hypothetical protein
MYRWVRRHGGGGRGQVQAGKGDALRSWRSLETAGCIWEQSGCLMTGGCAGGGGGGGVFMAGVPHGLDVAAAGRRQGAAGGQLAAWCAGGGRACRGR